MGTPQQPELHRSGTAPVDPDSDPSRLSRHRAPTMEDPPRRTPEENRPGHHPEREQDRPPLDAVAERLGTRPPESVADRGGPSSIPERAKTGAALGLTLLADGMGAAARGLRRFARYVDSGRDDDRGRADEHD